MLLLFGLMQMSTFLLLPDPIYPVNRGSAGGLDQGLDYYDFYVAGQQVRSGEIERVYQNPRFNKPPLVALLNALLCRLDYPTAFRLWQALLLSCVLGGSFLISKLCKATNLLGLLMSLAVVSCFPFHFLFDRGNLDGFSYLCAIAAVGTLSRGKAFGSGLLWGLGISLKPNIAALFLMIPIACKPRQWVRLLSGIVLVLGSILLVAPGLTIGFLHALLDKAGHGANSIDEQVSLVRFGLGLGIESRWFSSGLLLASSGLLVVLAWSANRRRPIPPEQLLLYFLPLCAAFPGPTYMYVLIAMPWAWLLDGADIPQVDRIALGMGIVLTQIPVHTLCVLAPDHVALIGWLPSLGVVLMIMASVQRLSLP